MKHSFITLDGDAITIMYKSQNLLIFFYIRTHHTAVKNDATQINIPVPITNWQKHFSWIKIY
ncbi:hypothetical protein EFN88_08610 [Leuconostoc citreum]|nr:hypothetical protein [Leuconostoc citreum]MCT3083334.1 hypothetical protein [Leuconostoc citreum]